MREGSQKVYRKEPRAIFASPPPSLAEREFGGLNRWESKRRRSRVQKKFCKVPDREEREREKKEWEENFFVVRSRLFYLVVQ